MRALVKVRVARQRWCQSFFSGEYIGWIVCVLVGLADVVARVEPGHGMEVSLADLVIGANLIIDEFGGGVEVGLAGVLGLILV